MASQASSKHAILAALIGNFLVAVTKGGAAAWTGSSAMLSEAIHSLVDTSNQVLLLYGMRSARRRATPDHPIGHGRELYFWSFIVALLIFSLGAGISIYQGVVHVLSPEPIRDPMVNYIVLFVAFVFESIALIVSLRAFNHSRGDLGMYEAIRRSKDAPLFIVLLEDSAALIGILIAAVGTFAAGYNPIFDGIASIAIGLLLAGTAVLLARESKSLLIGERASTELIDSILKIAGQEPSVANANGVISVHLSPDQVLVALSLEFEDELKATAIESAVIEIERKIREVHPEVVTLFVKPQTHHTFTETTRKRFG